MKRLATVGAAVAAVGGFLVVLGTLSRAQEPKPQPAQSTLVATIDLTPIQTELSALRAEMTALRQAVADPKGLREEVAQTATATKALDARLGELADLVKKQSESLKPALMSLDPATPWEYYCLRTRSENVANTLGRDGWQLVTGSGDWLFFRRPATPGRKTQRVPEAEKGQ